MKRSAEDRPDLVRVQRAEIVASLAGGLVHELNNVLAPSLLTAELLRQKLSPDDQWLVDAIENASRRGMKLLKELLRLAHGSSGDRGLVHPHVVIARAASLLRGTLPQPFTVAVDLPEALPRVEGDATELFQLTLDLGLAAIAATDKANELQLRAWADGDVVSIAAAATGPTASAVPLTDARDQRRMAAIRTIAEGHGGRLAKTDGAGFRVELPTAGEAPTAIPAELEGDGQLILLIEDDEDVRWVTSAILGHHRYRVMVANNSDEGVDLFRQRRPDLVITDLAMPGEDGRTTIRRLTELDPGVPIIAATGLSGGPDELGIAGPLAGFLKKPFDGPTLLTAVAGALAQS